MFVKKHYRLEGVMLKQLLKIKEGFNNLSRRIDSSNEIYTYFTKDIPDELNLILNRQDLIIKGSIGKGYKTDHPWIAVLNKNITMTTLNLDLPV